MSKAQGKFDFSVTPLIFNDCCCSMSPETMNSLGWVI